MNVTPDMVAFEQDVTEGGGEVVCTLVVVVGADVNVGALCVVVDAAVGEGAVVLMTDD